MSDPDRPDRSLRPFTDALRRTILEAHADAATSLAQADDDETLEPPGDLTPFVAAYRREVSAWSGSPAPARAERRRSWAVPAMLAAAAVLLGFGVYVGLSVSAQRAEAPNHGNASLAGRTTDTHQERAVQRTVPAPRATRPPPRAEDHVDSGGEPLEASPPAPDPSAATSTGAPPTSPARAPSIREQAAEAKRAWRAGQLDRAERLFRHIAASRRASTAMREQAWADLFVLVRERDGRAAQARQWRRYLEARPRGRFADDLSAALCRRGSAGKSRSCWSDYLGEHPRGQHRAEARRELDRARAEDGR